MENKINELGALLTKHFGCTKPINKKGKLTEHGKSAYRVMITRIAQIGSLTSYKNVTDAIQHELRKIYWFYVSEHEYYCLEDLLIQFGSKCPIKKNNELSKSGWVAYGKMTSFLYDIENLVDYKTENGDNINDIVETLDMIAEE